MAYRSDEEARLQKKLIPVNIVICVLCLVSAISLIFAPLITVNLTTIKDAIIELVEEESGYHDDYNDDYDYNNGYEDGYDHGYEEGGDSENNWQDDFEFDFSNMDMSAMLSFLDGEFSITAFQLGQYAYSDEQILLPLIADYVDSLIVPTFSAAIASGLGGDVKDVDITGLAEKIEALNEVNSEEEMRTAANDLIEEVARLGDIEINDEDKKEMLDFFAEMYNKTVEATGGDFDIEKLVCVYASEGMELEEPATSYIDLINAMGENAGGDEYQDGQDMSIKEALDTAEEALKALSKGLFWLVMFPACTWLLLFLFALLHILIKNKRVAMWYVKLFGGIPWLIFGLLPTVMAGAITSVGPEMASVGAIIGAISSATWVSGICLILLWLVSIFWAHPIKKKIKRERRG